MASSEVTRQTIEDESRKDILAFFVPDGKASRWPDDRALS